MTLLSVAERPAVDAPLSASVQVLTADQIMTSRTWPSAARIVVDATGGHPPSYAMLARMVHIRRELRAAGGDLVLAADPTSAALLRSSGLHRHIPFRSDVVTAMAAVASCSRCSGVTQTRPGGPLQPGLNLLVVEDDDDDRPAVSCAAACSPGPAISSPFILGTRATPLTHLADESANR